MRYRRSEVKAVPLTHLQRLEALQQEGRLLLAGPLRVGSVTFDINTLILAADDPKLPAADNDALVRDGDYAAQSLATVRAERA